MTAEVVQQPTDVGGVVALPPAPFGTGRHRSNRDSNRSTRPSLPSSTSRRAVRKSPSHRRFWYTLSSNPRSAASRTSVVPSAAVAVSGLSTTTGSPASSAARASGACVRFGEATTTTSNSPADAHSSSAVPSSAVPGYAPAAARRRSGLAVTIALSRRPAVVLISGAWNAAPAVPYPTSPTRKEVSLMPCSLSYPTVPHPTIPPLPLPARPPQPPKRLRS
ncbi:hypothetical protein GCM10027610_089720 [Dactylosporangium cerinum]